MECSIPEDPHMSRTLDLKTLAIGLLLGVCLMAARGHREAEPQHELVPHPRYQITASARGELPHGLRVYVLDHLTHDVSCYQQADVHGKKWVREHAFHINE
jgi:hypothetical protein